MLLVKGIMDASRLDAEAAAVRRRYDRREGGTGPNSIYHPLRLDRILVRYSKERLIAKRLRRDWLVNSFDARVLEVGCGQGANLSLFVSFGFEPRNLVGVELLDERARRARELLPPEVAIHTGDATRAGFEPASFDIIIQSTVFSSILAPDVRAEVARQMWDWLKPGGNILWYDLAVDNPKNPDVVGISRQEIQELFPRASFEFHRVTLAPPIGRLVIGIGGWLYQLLDSVPFLRSHTLAWGVKSAGGDESHLPRQPEGVSE